MINLPLIWVLAGLTFAILGQQMKPSGNTRGPIRMLQPILMMLAMFCILGGMIEAGNVFHQIPEYNSTIPSGGLSLFETAGPWIPLSGLMIIIAILLMSLIQFTKEFLTSWNR